MMYTHLNPQQSFAIAGVEITNNGPTPIYVGISPNEEEFKSQKPHDPEAGESYKIYFKNRDVKTVHCLKMTQSTNSYKFIGPNNVTLIAVPFASIQYIELIHKQPEL